jgi:hypothetical protein
MYFRHGLRLMKIGLGATSKRERDRWELLQRNSNAGYMRRQGYQRTMAAMRTNENEKAITYRLRSLFPY